MTTKNLMDRCSVNSCDFCECSLAAQSLYLRMEQSKNVFNVEFFSRTNLLNAGLDSRHSPEAKGEDYLFGRLSPAVENLVDGCSIYPGHFRERHLAACPLNLGTEQLNNLCRLKWSLEASARLANGGASHIVL